GPGPVEGLPDAGRVAVVAPRHHVAVLGPAAGIDPAAAGGAAVVAQLAEARELLALAAGDAGGVARIAKVLQRTAVVLLRELLRGGVLRAGVVPGQVEDRIREGATLGAVQLAHAGEDERHDLDVALGLARRLGALPVPLQPAAGVHQRALLLGEAGGRQADHLGLDAGGVDVVGLAVVLPERRGLGDRRVHDTDVLKHAQRG